MNDEINDICKHFDASFLFDEFSCSIAFKDGKVLKYAMMNAGKSMQQVFEDLKGLMASNAHGRIFKDNKFVGYAPTNKSIDEVLVAIDMMV